MRVFRGEESNPCRARHPSPSPVFLFCAVGDTREEKVFRMWINSLAVDNGDLYINNLFADVQNGFAILKASQCVDRVDRVLPLSRSLFPFERLFVEVSTPCPHCGACTAVLSFGLPLLTDGDTLIGEWI